MGTSPTTSPHIFRLVTSNCCCCRLCPCIQNIQYCEVSGPFTSVDLVASLQDLFNGAEHSEWKIHLRSLLPCIFILSTGLKSQEVKKQKQKNRITDLTYARESDGQHVVSRTGLTINRSCNSGFPLINFIDVQLFASHEASEMEAVHSKMLGCK